MKIRKKNMGINAILNVIRQGLSVLFPLITFPYALRVLGAEGIGKVTYISSIISYFTLIAMLGVSTYAVREGAKIRDDRKKATEFFSQVFTINIIFTVISYGLLCGITVLSPQLSKYTLLILIQSFSIISTTLAVDWINTVYEDFMSITIRSIVSHMISLILLFLLVKSSSDYYIYASLMILSVGITNVYNFFYCRKKYIKLKLVKNMHFLRHIKPMIVMFANLVTISIYVNFDTTMLGIIKGDYAVGLYTVAVKIYNIIKNIMAAIYSVTIPRLSQFYGKDEMKKYKKLNTDIWAYMILLMLPACMGLASISKDVIYIMGGEGYLEATLALQILAGSLLFAVFGGLITACLNITIGKEFNNLIASVCAAILNVVLNLFFISKWGQNGAAFTTLLAEAFVFTYCFKKIENKEIYFDFRKLKIEFFHAALGSILMMINSWYIHVHIINPVFSLCLSISIGVILYVALLIVLKDSYVIDILTNIKNKKVRK